MAPLKKRQNEDADKEEETQASLDFGSEQTEAVASEETEKDETEGSEHVVVKRRRIVKKAEENPADNSQGAAAQNVTSQSRYNKKSPVKKLWLSFILSVSKR